VSGYFCVDNGTLTFDSYKPLHMAEASAPLCGKIICADIGIRDEWHPEF
jgi:NAD(P)H-hydrate epimerase